MKKNFPLRAADRADARVIDAIKYDVRKYVKRERKKPFPEGFDLWDFACKVGRDQSSAEDKSLPDVGAAIDAIATEGGDSIYIEVLAVPARRIVSASVGPSAPTPISSAPSVPSAPP